MAGANEVLPKGYVAAAALSTTYLPVKASGTAGTHCTPTTAVTDRILGIAQEVCVAADVNKRVVRVLKMPSISKAYLRGTVTAGDPLKIAGTFDGFVTATVAGTDIVNAYAEESGVTGDIINVQLVSPSKL
jgi:hypothetical protein